MKVLLSTALIAGLLLFGCSDENTILEPETVSVTNSVEKSWISLPDRHDMSVETEFSVTEKINGNQGGALILQGSYVSAEGNLVEVNSDLTVPNFAYAGNEWITQVIGEDAAADFSPSMEFNNPLILNVTYTGVNLTDVNPEDVAFYYIAPDGTLTPAENDGITVDPATGTLSVIGAVIPHFSRYGFVK